jgi:hypothetical protein
VLLGFTITLEKTGIIQEIQMPRYNLNHQDIDSIVEGLDKLIKDSYSIQYFNRINSLKSRLLFRLNTQKNQNDQEGK